MPPASAAAKRKHALSEDDRVQTHVPHSKEAKMAQDSAISYGDALQRFYERREAFSNAFPFSAFTMGEGSAFLYRQGVLCVLRGESIVISDLHVSPGTTREIHIPSVLHRLGSPTSPPASPKISLLHYSDDIIALLHEQKGKSNSSYILAISTKAGTLDSERLVKGIPLESSSRLFVRHTAKYLYYGTYTGVGDHGHHEWIVEGVSLNDSYPLPEASRPLQLEDFFGTDIGSTIAFEIHNGYFYALSNQTSFDVEELDWTSFYHCIRFPLHSPTRRSVEADARIYRRQHAEGPIHDSWTDLTIQIDESTDEPMIVESRREWQNGSSKQTRTFYMQKIVFSPESKTRLSSDDFTGPLLPENDPFTALVDSSNNPNYAPSQARLACYTHPEFGRSTGYNRPFILARTKFRAYNFSCSSFIDLVEDEKCCADPTKPLAPPCLRLRIGSRRPEPLMPVEQSPNFKGKAPLSSASYLSPPEGESDGYRYGPIKMWPPPAVFCPCAKRLHSILNPPMASGSTYNRVISGAADERSIVYMVRPGRSYSSEETTFGTIVVVSFHRDTEAMRDDAMAKTEACESRWDWMPGLSSLCKQRMCH